MSVTSSLNNWFRRWINKPPPVNKFENLNVANNVAQLAAVRQNAQVQHATHVRLMTKMLGVPPSPLEDDMLAGGDIRIGSNLGPWIFATAVLLLLAFGWWSSQPKTVAASTTTAATTTATTPVATTTTTTTPTATSKNNPDYIEFYRP